MKHFQRFQTVVDSFIESWVHCLVTPSPAPLHCLKAVLGVYFFEIPFVILTLISRGPDALILGALLLTLPLLYLEISWFYVPIRNALYVDDPNQLRATALKSARQVFDRSLLFGVPVTAGFSLIATTPQQGLHGSLGLLFIGPATACTVSILAQAVVLALRYLNEWVTRRLQISFGGP